MNTWETWRAVLICSGVLSAHIIPLFVFDRKVRRKLMASVVITSVILFAISAATVIAIAL